MSEFEVEKMREALRACSAWFRDYASVQRGKRTQPGRKRADRAREMAEMCEAAVPSPPEPV